MKHLKLLLLPFLLAVSLNAFSAPSLFQNTLSLNELNHSDAAIDGDISNILTGENPSPQGQIIEFTVTDDEGNETQVQVMEGIMIFHLDITPEPIRIPIQASLETITTEVYGAERFIFTGDAYRFYIPTDDL